MGKQHQGCGEMVKQTSEYLHPYSLWNHNWGLQQGKLDFFFLSSLLKVSSCILFSYSEKRFL